jgi:excisionase family DNA binding protein
MSDVIFSIRNARLIGMFGMPRARRILPLPERRGLSRNEAAEYVGVPVSLFEQMVSDGRMPKPLDVGTRRIWDRRKLDASFAALVEERDLESDAWSNVSV